MKPGREDKFSKARDVFRRHHGLLRTQQALRQGIHPRILYGMESAGVVEKLSRGLYRLTELPNLGDPDLVTVSLKVPQGVICLISALAFHKLTTQIPHEVYIALARGAEPPRVDFPPIRVFWFASKPFMEGIETHKLDAVPVRVYNTEKTLADCFKYRNKIGIDTALEALRLYREQGRVKVDELMRYAAICRVQKIIRPYLEALL